MGMGDVTWLPYDEQSLASSGVSGQAARLLAERGLPADCNRMFVRDRDRELADRELPAGRAVFLGLFNEGIDSYWLLTDSGAVWMLRGCEGGPGEQYGLINTSVEHLVEVLRTWETFVCSGKSDGTACAGLRRHRPGRRRDPPARRRER